MHDFIVYIRSLSFVGRSILTTYGDFGWFMDFDGVNFFDSARKLRVAVQSSLLSE